MLFFFVSYVAFLIEAVVRYHGIRKGKIFFISNNIILFVKSKHLQASKQSLAELEALRQALEKEEHELYKLSKVNKPKSNDSTQVSKADWNEQKKDIISLLDSTVKSTL